MAESDFNELLHAAEQLSAEVEGSGELPKVERTLRQVLEASTELWSRVTQTGAQDIQAHLLLGSKGVDLPQLSQKLEGLSTRKTFEPLEPVCDSDVQTFLKNELENSLLAIIEETNKSAFEDAESTTRGDISERWKKDKKKSLQSLLAPPEELMETSYKPEVSVLNDSVIGMPKSSLNNQEMAYAKIVIDYNKIVVQGAVRPSLVEKFSEIKAVVNDKKVEELWNVVRYMVQIPPQSTGDPLACRQIMEVKQALIRQAKKYLEDRYKLFMISRVEGNLQKACRGGMPGTLPLVVSFVKMMDLVNMKGLEDGLVEGQPVWPLVYFCLRCGDIGAALHCARQAGERMDDLISILDEVHTNKEGIISARSEQFMLSQYQSFKNVTADPYKKVVYCVLGSCDPTDDHNTIINTADDYLWLKLYQAGENRTTQVSRQSSVSYSGLQSLISEEYGEEHYNAMEKPLLYFQMLFLTGQFEAAIEFLARIDKLRVHSVHVALTLNELGLLATPPDIQVALLSSEEEDPTPSKRLNLARLLMAYVSRFQHSDPREALQYYYFLRNMKDPEGQNLFMVCVSSFVMENRNFNDVLGFMADNGCRAPGLIDEFHGVQADVKQITEMVASDAERRGLFEDAISLYDLAGNHEKVLSLMTTLLSQVVQLENRPGSIRERLQQLSFELSNRYMGQQYQCFSDTLSRFIILRDLLGFFNQYHAKEYQQALEAMGKLKLIPMSMEELEERVNNFKHLGDEVCRCLPDVLLATMHVLHELCKKIKGGDPFSPVGGKFDDMTKEKQLSYLREKARAITSFAGTVPYHMPGDTNSRLVQLEILMN